MRESNQHRHLADKRSGTFELKCRPVRPDKSVKIVKVVVRQTRQHSWEAAQRNSFGATEISRGAARLPASGPEAQPGQRGLIGEIPLAELVTRCENFGGSKGFFGRRDDEIIEALNLSYALYQRIKNDVRAQENLREQVLQHARERKPPNGNAALLAMLFVCRPGTEEQRKLCSDYSSALIWAEDEIARADDFARAWRSTTLTACKKYVREKRRAAKSERRGRQKEPYIEIRIGRHSSDVLVKLPICLHEYEALLRIKGDTATAVFHPVLREIQSIAVTAAARDTS